VQRPHRIASGDRGVGRAGLLQRRLGAELYDGVDGRVHGIDAAQVRADHFGGRHLPVAYQLRQLRG
jgi:hypothetical protein